MASRSLLAVLVLLLGLHGTYAALCTTTALVGTGTCTCPGGIASTAEAGKFSVATVGVVTTITRIVHTGTTVDITKCANVQKGYEIKTASSNYGLLGPSTLTPGITLVGANSYSAEAVGKVTYSSGKISGLTQSLATACPTGIGHAATGKFAITDCKDLLAKYTLIPSVTAGTTISGLVRACTVNEYGCRGKTNVFTAVWTKTSTGITGTPDMTLTGANSIAAVTTSAAGTVTSTTLLPFACPTKSATTLAQTIGVTIASCLVDKDYYIDATNLLTPLACPAGSICPGGFAVGTASASHTGLYGVCTTASIGTVNGKCYCPGGTTAATSAGDYTSAIGTGDIYATLTHAGNGLTKVGVCKDILPGYEVKTASTTTLDITPAATLTAGITAIAANSFAPSVVNKVTYTGAKITALGQSLATSCPTGTGNSLTSAATGQAAISFQTACVDLLAKFSIKKSVTATTSLSNLVVACVADQYNCPGSANLFSIKNVDAGTGIFNTANNMDITALNVIGSTGTINQGTLLVESCPAGSSTTSAQTVLTTVAGCTVNGGYYIDASDLEVPSICPIGDYCVGGGAVGTAGGITSCPYGSSTELASAQNSRVSDCVVSSDFYIATGALNTPVPCLASFICSGGTPLGTAGGSVACPVGSLHASCAGSSPSTTVTVSATPISVATPDVTVTNTVPSASASSASTNVVSMVLLAVSAAMVAF